MPSTGPDARERFGTAVEDAVSQLRGLGATPEVCDRVAEVARRVDHDDGDHVVLVANAAAGWAWPAPHDIGHLTTSWSSLPRITPLLATQATVVPHLLVLVDREGADLELVDAAVELDRTVSGDTEHIHRSKPGGWSQRRHQQRAENTWEQNAKETARVISEVHDDEGPEVVVLAGDERAVGFVVDALPAHVAGVTIVLEHGGRAAGADPGPRTEELARALAARDAAQVQEGIETFRSALANDQGAEGIEQTLDRLHEGLVDTLLLRADLDDDRTAYHGPEPYEVSAGSERLESLGVTASPAPLADAALRAALGTGASVLFVGDEPDGPAAGIGAILRDQRPSS